MNWFDYLRGYEEGRYEGTVSGRDSGLLGSLIQLGCAIVLLAFTLSYFTIKIMLMLLWKIVKIIAGKS